MDEMTNEQYSQYIGSISPKTQCGKNMLFAFLVGGGICTVGQAWLNFYTAQGLDSDATGSAVCITMIALGALLTGLGVYDKLANMGEYFRNGMKAILKNHNMPYQVNGELMKHAASDAVFMHCLPAYRGYEVTEEVIDGPQSVIFDEAENRLHAQKAVMATLMG